MNLIAVLIVLLLEYFLGHLRELRDPGWFERYAGWLRERFGAEWEGPAAVALVVVPAGAAVALLQGLFGAFLFGLPGFLFAIVVLLYCIGPRDLAGDLESYLEAREAGDEARAQRIAGRFLGEAAPDDPGRRDRAVLAGLLEQADERLFGVFFWFVLLGAVGAALYRMAAILRRVDEARFGVGFAAAARFFYEVMEWIPARLLALGYALSGSFDGAWQGWRRSRENRREGVLATSPGVLVYAGFGALHLDAEEPGAPTTAQIADGLRLVHRALLVWLTVLALLTLAGWAG